MKSLISFFTFQRFPLFPLFYSRNFTWFRHFTPFTSVSLIQLFRYPSSACAGSTQHYRRAYQHLLSCVFSRLCFAPTFSTQAQGSPAQECTEAEPNNGFLESIIKPCFILGVSSPISCASLAPRLSAHQDYLLNFVQDVVLKTSRLPKQPALLATNIYEWAQLRGESVSGMFQLYKNWSWFLLRARQLLIHS